MKTAKYSTGSAKYLLINSTRRTKDMTEILNLAFLVRFDKKYLIARKVFPASFFFLSDLNFEFISNVAIKLSNFY